jgi:hypothetical protein
MAVVFAEGFETAYLYSDLVARGSYSPYYYNSSATKYTLTANGAAGISANGGTALVNLGASVATASYTQYSVVTSNTFNLNSANSQITVAARLYYDPNAVANPSIRYGCVFTDGTNYWMPHAYSTTADITLLSGMTSTGATASAPVYHTPITAALPNSSAVYVFDGILYNGYMYVLSGSGTTLNLSQYANFTTSAAPIATATATLTSFAGGTTTFSLVSTNGYIVVVGTDANVSLRFCTFSINATTGAPTFVQTVSQSSTTSVDMGPAFALTSAVNTWAANTIFAAAGGSATVMGYTSPDSLTWTALTTTVGSTPAVGSRYCATNGSVVVFGSAVIGTTASVYTLTLSTNTWTTVKIATDTYTTAVPMMVAYNAGIFLAIREQWTNTGWTSTDGINWTAITLPAVVANSSQLATRLYARGGFFWLHLNTGDMFSANGTTWTPVSFYSTTLNHMCLGSTFGAVAGFTNGTTAQYITGTSTANTIALTAPTQGWHTYEFSMTKTSATAYTANWYIDGLSQASQTATYSTWPQTQAISGTLSSIISSTNPMAYSPTLDLMVLLTSTTINICSGTKSAGNVSWTVVGPTLTNPLVVKWVRNQFILLTKTTWYSSTNGLVWTAMTGTPTNTALSDISDNGSLCLVTTLDTTTYYTSPDLVTWTTRTLPSIGYSVANLNGQWVIVNAANGTSLYSADGINWTSFTAVLNQGSNMISDGVSKIVYFGGSSTIVTLTVTGSGAPTYSTAATGVAVGGGQFAWNSSGFIGQLSNSSGNYLCTFPTGGSSWTITLLNSTASNCGTVSVNGNTGVLINSNTSKYVCDLGSTQWYLNFAGALAVDDIIVVDNNTPLNMKIPLGKIRIAKNTTSSGVQAQWNPTPSGDANYVAASLIPLSTSSAQYVSTGVVSNKDIYQTTSTAPAGYGAKAVATEAFSSGLSTDTPQVQIGLIANSVESDAASVPIVVTGTSYQFLQQIHNTDPSSNAWTNTSAASPEITITKTA